MDEIQKVLVKAGRKDLARDYYHIVSVKNSEFQNLVGNYVITGIKLPSENRCKLAKIKAVSLLPDIEKKIKKGLMSAEAVDWDDLSYSVITEDSRRMNLKRNEIDHFLQSNKIAG